MSKTQNISGKLYLVPTPIGNLEDITYRAVKVLGEVDSIICEDTRQTIKLLNRYEIKKPLISFYTYNQDRRIPQLIRDLSAGKNMALVSDGGMPGISDPGYFLVSAALKENISVTALPGPSAAITALVASGLPSEGYIFLGFLKKKPGKMRKELREAAACGKTIIFYESPHRIKKTIHLCKEVFSADSPAVIARELTKIYEEYIRGTLEQVDSIIQSREIKGEIVVLISPISVLNNGDTGNKQEE